ncbi:50S ribosomal protein L2 [Candidatus Uhrbacteria bacterium]|nr:50S ribosomal protein L2 [Candidatus Uhrbacteria bacterium]
MAVKIYKPTSPGRRKSSVGDFSMLTKKRPERSLIVIKKKTGGRNNQGKITTRHRGGGTKRYYRIIDFARRTHDVPARVISLEYDPNRSANIALIEYEGGVRSYIIAPQDLNVGDTIVSSQKKQDIVPGNRLCLNNIPVGTFIHALEITPGRGAQMIRSAGVFAQLMAIDGDTAHVRLPSGEVRLFRVSCMATIGQVGNSDHQHIRLGKAGRRRHLGWRPSVRGKAMNPVDHPHGGGEGNQPIGMKGPKTPSGRPALGLRTRKKKKYSNSLILKRRSKKR